MFKKQLAFALFCIVQVSICSGLAYGQSQQREHPFTHIVEVEDDVDLHVVDWGGTGPVLLFVPSWASTSHIFDEFAPVFTDSYRVLVMNVRGHGPSTRPDHGYTIERLTQDIEAVLDQLDIEIVNLVGLSRSASLTTQFAAKYPDRTASLIYLSGPIDRAYNREFISKPENRRAGAERSDIDDAILELCGINFTPELPPGSDDNLANEVGVEWRNTDPAPPYADVKAAALAFWMPVTDLVLQYEHACAEVEDRETVEMLLQDFNRASIPFYEKSAHDMAIFEQQMANGKIVIIPGSDYNTFVTHPKLVEDQMRLFLTEQL
jgi:pimeloyl-ACP methyl ester carboxylesterase